MPRSTATSSSPPSPDLFAHRRILFPMPSGTRWAIGCRCGWKDAIDLEQTPIRSRQEANRRLELLFVDHLPKDGRTKYLLADARRTPDPSDPEGERSIVRGCWIMPEGAPCRMDRFWESDGLRYGHVVEPDMVLPVGEIWTEDGRYFRAE